MYIERIRLQNVRCFSSLEMSFELGRKQLPWTVVIGDNATGKTTLLRSIAMGLCDESSAAGLLKESDSPYIRYGEKKARIVVDLVKNLDNRRRSYRIETTIHRRPTRYGSYERVRQKTTPSSRFPWDELFVCGYGAGRSTSGAGDIVGYSVINAVYNMFNYTEGLQNPELAITRIPKDSFARQVLKVLAAVTNTDRVVLGKSGIEVLGPWDMLMPLRDLADGYKSTFLWVTDLLGWALNHKPSLRNIRQVTGIVLIDEIEQHLHPTWQTQVVQRLRTTFPSVQFIITTHSPLVASSVGSLQTEVNVDNLMLLELKKGNIVVKHNLEQMKGLRFDQVLASKAFEYLTTSDRETNELLRKISILSGKGSGRTRQEDKEYRVLKQKAAKRLLSEAETPAENEIMEEFTTWMAQKLRKLKKKSRKVS
ncbi:MAG: AAA family ATPase [Gammaproteobacteria bacterium]